MPIKQKDQYVPQAYFKQESVGHHISQNDAYTIQTAQIAQTAQTAYIAQTAQTAQIVRPLRFLDRLDRLNHLDRSPRTNMTEFSSLEQSIILSWLICRHKSSLKKKKRLILSLDLITYKTALLLCNCDIYITTTTNHCSNGQIRLRKFIFIYCQKDAYVSYTHALILGSILFGQNRRQITDATFSTKYPLLGTPRHSRKSYVRLSYIPSRYIYRFCNLFRHNLPDHYRLNCEG